jgi:hypothetical protein
MNRLIVIILLCLSGTVSTAGADSMASKKVDEHFHQGGTMHISIRANGNNTRFELNDSPAAAALYAQLPLTLKAESYSNNEMIFYPPEKLATDHTPLANAKAGTLAYYAPWGDVVMFYKDFGSASGLYELGQAVSGAEHIRKISGTIKVEKADQ